MQIDWFTVVAQILNFLVLVWLLQRFLYKPITRAMKGREQRIANRIEDAEKARRTAEEEAQHYRAKQRELEESREAAMAEARDAATKLRRSLEQEARDEVEGRRQDWIQQLEAQQERFMRDLRHSAADRFWVLARRALADLADEEVEERIALAFARKLDSAEDPSSEAIFSDAGRNEDAVLVRSRYPLSANARRQITRVLHERLGVEAGIEYADKPDLACGIELVAGGQVLRWNLEGYLEQLEAELTAHFAEAGAMAEAREGA